ncbi:hypothetical protein YERSI8AC_10262 [Enterobacterales bacterium 8AC]|nr:hypothetical protein YERSI8AC_10262 [Enterobacterales bacterium 8AC]
MNFTQGGQQIAMTPPLPAGEGRGEGLWQQLIPLMLTLSPQERERAALI